jgi:hypothetical protein
VRLKILYMCNKIRPSGDGVPGNLFFMGYRPRSVSGVPKRYGIPHERKVASMSALPAVSSASMTASMDGRCMDSHSTEMF